MPTSKSGPKVPDFDVLSRHYLARGLSKHPDTPKHVANVEELQDMPIGRLLTHLLQLAPAKAM